MKRRQKQNALQFFNKIGSGDVLKPSGEEVGMLNLPVFGFIPAGKSSHVRVDDEVHSPVSKMDNPNYIGGTNFIEKVVEKYERECRLRPECTGLQGVDFLDSLTFDKGTGMVHLLDKPIGQFKPKSRDYFFIHLLHSNMPNAVSYEDLMKYVMQCLGKKAHSKTPQAYCHDVKCKIGNKFPAVANLLTTFSDSNGKSGYRIGVYRFH